MDYTGIMDHCTNKQNQKKLWNWANTNTILYIEEVIGADMKLRHWIIEDEKQ